DNDSFVTGFLSKEGCTYTIEEYCSSGDHNDSIGYGDCGIDFYSIVITETCTPSGGGGAGSLGDSGEPVGNDTGSTNTGDTSGSQTNNGGSGGSSSNGGVTTPTTPCRGDDCPEELDIDDLIHKKNCEELQELLDIEPGSVPAPYKTLKEAIADLKNNLDGASEEGYEIRHNSNLEPLFVKVNSNNTGEGYCNYSKVPSVYGGLHLHLNNTHPDLDSDYEPMFSHKDIKDLLEFTEIYSNPSSLINSSLFVHLIVTYQGTYAIKIKDLTKLQHLNTIWAEKESRKDFKRFLDSQYRRKTDNFSNPNGTAEDYQKIFLKHINIKYDLGISLFKTTEYNGEPVGWEELILVNGDTANSDVVKKPCNE
ncbi:type 1 glutamine amidotransferase family protein, partial [Bizionia saleffrena]|uniref:hypothetical protein n=1 Tax=Bizionia saleffrena TaxID=291189 RepID=UPI001C011CC0